MTFLYSQRPLPCSALIREIPPEANGNKYKDPQSDIIQSVRGLRTQSSKWIVFIKSFPSELKESFRGRKSISQEGMENAKKTRPSVIAFFFLFGGLPPAPK